MTEDTFELAEVGRFTNEELIARLKSLARVDQTLNARLVVHLGEVEARGLYRDQAYSSMFAYCVEEFQMTENQAYLRLQAARLGRRFPRVLQLLAQGALSLTSIKMLAPHLTPDNHEQLLERARGKSKQEIELLLAAIAPKPDVPPRMRKLPTPSARRTASDMPSMPTSVEARQAPFALEQTPFALEAVVTPSAGAKASRIEMPQAGDPTSAQSLDTRATPPLNASDLTCRLAHAPHGAPSLNSLTGTPPSNASDPTCGIAPHAAPPLNSPTGAAPLAASSAPLDGASDPNRTAFALQAPRPRGSSKPLSPGRYKVEFTAGQALHDKLVQLQELLRHQVPDGDLAVIVERAADLLIESTMKQRFAQTRAPKKSRPAKPHNTNSRYIPRAVVREVHQRDAGRCTFVSSEGKRCAERGFLEFHHHDRPFARGGEATSENLRLVCRAHNSLFAERDYGRSFMRSKRRQASEQSNERVPKRVPNLIRSLRQEGKSAEGAT